METQATQKSPDAERSQVDHQRFLRQHEHLSSAFGSDAFGLRAEAFARFFGTPTFIILQTIIVAIWIVANIMGLAHFDAYPFILLNLAFSLQAAYAAPLILLAQTRQAERDKAHSDADAQHREAIATESARQSALMLSLLQQNTELTEVTKSMAARIETLTVQLHAHLLQDQARASEQSPPAAS